MRGIRRALVGAVAVALLVAAGGVLAMGTPSVAAEGLGSAIGAAAANGSASPAAPRIVSLSPHITELLFAAGAGARVVGVDDSSDFPPSAARIPRLGEPAALDVEALLRAQPTLVIAWESGTPNRLLDQLRKLNLHLYVTEQRTLDDIATALLNFGRLGDSSETATVAAQSYRSELADLRMRYAGVRRLRVFYQVWDRPLYTLSGGHVVSEVLSLCGGDNIFRDLSTLAPAVDREAVLARDPDVILIGASGAEGERQAAEWSGGRDRHFASSRAGAAGRVFTVDPTLVGRMTPRIIAGIRQVCTALDQARDGVRDREPGAR